MNAYEIRYQTEPSKQKKTKQTIGIQILIFRLFESHFVDIDFFADLELHENIKLCAVWGLATVCENYLLIIICDINSCLQAEISLH